VLGAIKINRRMNPWIYLLLAFRAGKFPEYNYGFTPKLIVRACQIPIGKKFDNEELAYKVTKQLFLEMKSYDSNGLIVQSTFCDIHKGAVFNLSDTKWKENSINVTFEKLWNRYGEEIKKGRYNISNSDYKKVK
jgi:hypothetical protein